MGFFDPVGEILREARRKFPNHALIAGNVSMPAAAAYLWDHGADCVRVGTGPGGVCVTWDNSGTGREQVSAVVDCARELARFRSGKPRYLNADGGIRYHGDICIALAAGAHTVTLGSMLAGMSESPGETVVRKGRPYKKYRGMGSEEAMRVGGAARYRLENAEVRVPEGSVRWIPIRGSVMDRVAEYMQGVRQGMFKAGCRNILELHAYAQLIRARKQEKRVRMDNLDDTE